MQAQLVQLKTGKKWKGIVAKTSAILHRTC